MWSNVLNGILALPFYIDLRNSDTPCDSSFFLHFFILWICCPHLVACFIYLFAWNGFRFSVSAFRDLPVLNSIWNMYYPYELFQQSDVKKDLHFTLCHFLIFCTFEVAVCWLLGFWLKNCWFISQLGGCNCVFKLELPPLNLSCKIPRWINRVFVSMTSVQLPLE